MFKPASIAPAPNPKGTDITQIKTNPWDIEYPSSENAANAVLSAATFPVPKRLIIRPLKILEMTVTSDRVDVVISGVYHVSRSESLSYFEKAIVYVNGRLCTSNAKNLKKGDVVNVRGKGKFLYGGTQHITKKDKCRISVQVYG